RPPIGVFDLADTIILIVLIIVAPAIYLIAPLWLVGGMLVLGALNILYLTWAPILRNGWAIWLVVLLIVLSVIIAAVSFTTSNEAGTVMMSVAIMNLWVQSGMKTLYSAILAIFLTSYDFISTVQLPVMNDMIALLANLPFSPTLAWISGQSTRGIGLGDLLMI